MKTHLVGILLPLLATACFAAEPPAILPAPKSLSVGAGTFKLTPDTRICTDDASRASGEFLAAQLRKSTGYKFEVTASPQAGAVQGAILLTTADAKADLSTEGYALTVAPDSVVVRAPRQAGVFYGAQTLLQLLPPEVFAAQPAKGVDWTVPCVQIEDQPRFPWRGMMLDVSRHFFNKEEIKKVLDALVLNKINTFHWHLTDDQGWRIEIKKYPKLTEEGAWRKDIGYRMSPKDSPKEDSTAYGPDGRYGGFYTQDDVREIIAYAAERHITIIPEIDMPGHAMAAMSLFPEFACPGVVLHTDVEKQPGVYNGIYCAGNDAAIEFAQNVLAEVIALFPAKYIHIGGDEVPKANWKQCGKCQARIKAEGLKDEAELQSYFIRRIEKFISAQGRTLVGWSEILHGGIAPGAVLMDWIGGGLEAASAGHDVVMTPTTACYFDYIQSRDALEPYGPGVLLTLSQVYAFEPVPEKLAPQFAAHILGAQGNLWTEHIPSLKHLEYMTFPRLSALAEVMWSPKDARDWEDFNRRLQVQFQRFDQLGINYRRETEVTLGEWSPKVVTNGTPVDLEWDVTRYVKGVGNLEVTFNYLRGAWGMSLVSLTLLEDGRKIDSDVHAGVAGGVHRDHVYTVSLPAFKAGAHYTLRGQIQASTVNGSPGTDSFGNVTLKMLPLAEKPRSSVEKSPEPASQGPSVPGDE